MFTRSMSAALICVAAATAHAQDLTVYTALEADQIKAYQAGFAKAYPEIRIRWVRDPRAW